VTLTSPETGRMRAVLLPTATFLALPPAKGLPRNKPWLKVSEATRSTLGRQLQPMGEQLRASIDPAQNVGLLLAAGQVTEVGHGTVEGVPATEHRAVVDLRQAVQLADDPGVRAQYRAMLAAGVRTLEYELWVDDSSLPLRVHADVPRTTGVFSMTGVFRRWGEPPADRRADGQAGLRRRRPQELNPAKVNIHVNVDVHVHVHNPLRVDHAILGILSVPAGSAPANPRRSCTFGILVGPGRAGAGRAEPLPRERPRPVRLRPARNGVS
jgi:hypothetical protein